MTEDRCRKSSNGKIKGLGGYQENNQHPKGAFPSTVGSKSTLPCTDGPEKGSGAHGCGPGVRTGQGLAHRAMGSGFLERTELNGPKAGEWPFLVVNFKNNIGSG